jgi:hypothetical protein
MRKSLWIVAVWLFVGPAAAQEVAKPAPLDQAALEKKFEQDMTGVYLKGFFTLLGREEKQGLKEEKYTINSVKKVEGDKWLFNVRIQYGNIDLPVTLPLDVKWAGDTPVITLTDVAVPGIGTFTSRVLIYRGQYAGTWEGGKEPDGSIHGGNLFGVLEKIEKQTRQ